MSTIKTFEFDRSRGVVWVCDLANSSRYLNDDNSAKALEEFLPRFYWTAAMLVEAAGGRFIKWTGDGFLAWFETPLHRNQGQVAADVFSAAWHLTFLVNVTQLNLSLKGRFRIRHGITYEHDALLIRITHSDGHRSLDLIGRAVVLAFRISTIEASFPAIVTHGELVEAIAPYGSPRTTFQKRRITKEERLKVFKGHSWQTGQIFTSVDRKTKPAKIGTISKIAKEAIAKAEKTPAAGDEDFFIMKFLKSMISGPTWCREVIAKEVAFVRDDLYIPLKGLVSLIESRGSNVDLSNREQHAKERKRKERVKRH